MPRVEMIVARLAMVCVVMVALAGVSWAEVPADVGGHERCAVCGMKVAKYPEWIAQVELADGRVEMFDGPKDMLVFYFTPEEYEAQSAITSLVVKDYYSQEWLDAKAAFYVIGSDVYGPMGKEFIPFSSKEAAENFVRDHHGERILLFSDIDNDLVQSMRKGHMMKKKMGH